jgi:hypothetical protein
MREKGRRWEAISLSIDGKAQYKTKYPCTNKQYVDKSFCGWGKNNQVQMHIVSVIVHGWKTFFFDVPDWIPTRDHQSGAITATLITHVLGELLREKPWGDKPMPGHLNINWDGGSENRNKELYGFMEWVAAEGPFEKVSLSRLPIGHTHNDNDQEFGVMDGHFQKSCGKHTSHDMFVATSWSEWCHEAREALQNNREDSEQPPEFVRLATTFNISSWLDECIDPDYTRYGSTLDWLGGDYDISDNGAVRVDPQNIPVLERVRTAKVYYMEYFKKDGIVWHRVAPNLVDPPVWWPQNCDGVNPIGTGTTLHGNKPAYGLRLLVKLPEGVPTYNRPIHVPRPAGWGGSLRDAYEIYTWMTPAGCEENYQYTRKIPTSETDPEAINAMFLTPAWHWDDLDSLAMPIVARPPAPVPVPGTTVTLYTPICTGVEGHTADDSKKLRDKIQLSATVVGSRERSLGELKTSELVFFRSTHEAFLHMSVSLTQGAWKWLPLVLGEVVEVLDGDTRVRVKVYHGTSYEAKHKLLRTPGSNMAITTEVDHEDLLLSKWGGVIKGQKKGRETYCGKTVTGQINQATRNALESLVEAHYDVYRTNSSTATAFLDAAGIESLPIKWVGELVYMNFPTTGKNPIDKWYAGRVIKYDDSTQLWEVKWTDRKTTKQNLASFIQAASNREVNKLNVDEATLTRLLDDDEDDEDDSDEQDSGVEGGENGNEDDDEEDDDDDSASDQEPEEHCSSPAMKKPRRTEAKPRRNPRRK